MVRLLWLLPLAAAACGPSASSDAYERTTHACVPGVCVDASVAKAVDAGIDLGGLEPWPDQGAGPVSGVYAALAVTSATLFDMTLSLQLLYRVRLLEEPSGPSNMMQSITLCAIQLPGVMGIATLAIPPRLQALIPEKSVVVAEGNFLQTMGGTKTYTPPPLLFLLGAKLANPTTDPLPTLMDLTGEWDEDQDGNPGVTIDATVPILCTATGQLYVALRTAGTITGTFSGDDVIDGTVAISEAQSVLGYSDPCLSDAVNFNPTLSPTATFHAQRLADEATLDTKGNVSCADVVTAAPMLFGSAWTGD